MCVSMMLYLPMVRSSIAQGRVLERLCATSMLRCAGAAVSPILARAAAASSNPAFAALLAAVEVLATECESIRRCRSFVRCSVGHVGSGPG